MTVTADVTVVVPALNRAGLIARSLRSIQQQRLLPAEVIVVDDASEDGTAGAAEAMGAKVLSMPTRSGSGPARNAGIAAATTRWVAFLDSDDEWEPDHLETLMHAAEGSSDVVLLAAAASTSGGRWLGNPWTSPLRLGPRQLLVPSDLVVTSGTMVLREVLETVGGFRPLRRAQDLDLWLRVLERGPGLSLPTATVFYHEHDEQASADKALMREHFSMIMATVKDQPWMTPALYDGAWSRVVWDDARRAQRERDWRTALGHLRWLARRPRALTALVAVVRQRRRAKHRAGQLTCGR